MAARPPQRGKVSPTLTDFKLHSELSFSIASPPQEEDCNVCPVRTSNKQLDDYLNTVQKLQCGPLLNFVLDARVQDLESDCNEVGLAPLRPTVSNIRNQVVAANAITDRILTLSYLQIFIFRSIRDTDDDLLVIAFGSAGKSAGITLAVVDSLASLRAQQLLSCKMAEQNTDFYPPMYDPYSGRTSDSRIPLQIATESRPQFLILVPTHELLDEALTRVRTFCNRIDIGVAAARGKSGSKEQTRDQQLCRILVATPGKVFSMMEEGQISWVRLQYVFFDEANVLCVRPYRGAGAPIRNQEPTVADHTHRIFFGPVEKGTPPISTLPYASKIKRFFATTSTDPDCVDHMEPFARKWPIHSLRAAIEPLTVDVFFIGIDLGKTNDQKAERRAATVAAYVHTLILGKLIIFTHKIKGQKLLQTAMADVGETRPTTRVSYVLSGQERQTTVETFTRSSNSILLACKTVAYGVNVAELNKVVVDQPYDEYNELYSRLHRCGRKGNQGNAWVFFDRNSDEEVSAVKSACTATNCSGGRARKPVTWDLPNGAAA